MRRLSTCLLLTACVAPALAASLSYADLSDRSLQEKTLEAREFAQKAAQYEQCGVNTFSLKKAVLDHLGGDCKASAAQIATISKAYDTELASRSATLERRGLACSGDTSGAQSSYDELVSAIAQGLKKEKC